MDPLFADAFANFGRVIVNLLAVAGGFLIGNVLMLVVSRIAAKFVFKKKLPRMLDQILRLVGGLVVALLVAMLVFGDGGWGFGGSGGGRPGGPGGSTPEQPDEKKADESKDVRKDPPKTKDAETPDERVKIVVLGGDAPPDHYYLFEDERTASTLVEVSEKMRVRHEKKPLKRLTIFVYKNSAAKETAVVNDLENLARSLTLTIDFPPVQRDLRPER